MHTTIIKGLIMAAIPAALLLGAPTALASPPVHIDAQGEVRNDSVEDAWTQYPLHAYSQRGGAFSRIEAHGTERAADMAVRKTESHKAEPQDVVEMRAIGQTWKKSVCSSGERRSRHCRDGR